MRVVKCSNKHFYDGDQFAECPHCGEAPLGDKAPDMLMEKTSVTETEKGGWFSRHRKEKGKEKNESYIPLSKQHEISVASNRGYDPNRGEDVKRTGFGAAADHTQAIDSFRPLNEDDFQIGIAAKEVLSNRSEEKVPSEPREIHPISTLQEEINRASAVDSKTMFLAPSSSSREPVVGWLVCIKGKSLGESYPLQAQRNFIGRSLNNTVVLKDEPTVSREEHAILTYEPKKRAFLIQPGKGNGLVYCNDELVMTYETLKAYDVLQLGEVLLLFVPLCGEQFDWSEYTKQGEKA